MPKPSSLKEQTARALLARIEQQGRAVGAALGTPYQNVTLTPERERRLFWQRDPEADEAALWQAGKRPDEISKALYPHRWKILNANGRIKLKQQVEWAERMLRLGPPEGTPVPQEAQDGPQAAPTGAQAAEPPTEAPAPMQPPLPMTPPIAGGY